MSENKFYTTGETIAVMRGLDIQKPHNADSLARINLPAIVGCSSCGDTMSIFSCLVDNKNFIFCWECADETVIDRRHPSSSAGGGGRLLDKEDE